MLGSFEVQVRADAELVKAVLGGERRAFAELVKRYERAVRGVAVSVLAEHSLAGAGRADHQHVVMAGRKR